MILAGISRCFAFFPTTNISGSHFSRGKYKWRSSYFFRHWVLVWKKLNLDFATVLRLEMRPFFIHFAFAICKKCIKYLRTTRTVAAIALSNFCIYFFYNEILRSLLAMKLNPINSFTTKADIIQKPVHWFAEQINGLVSIWYRPPSWKS